MAQTGKPFTSIENQVAILRRRGVLTDEETPKILLRETEYLAAGLKDYDGNIHELHRVMRSAIRHPRNDAVRYYIEERGYVPLWVLMSTLTFGNVEHFFNLMKPEEQKLVCKRIVKALSEEDGSRRGYLAPITARRALDILVKYRNKCAHDERLYCARVGYRREINFKKMMEYAAIFHRIFEKEWQSSPRFTGNRVRDESII